MSGHTIEFIPDGTVITCWTCNGTGRIPWCSWLCGYCGGTGKQVHYANSTTVTVRRG